MFTLDSLFSAMFGLAQQSEEPRRNQTVVVPQPDTTEHTSFTTRSGKTYDVTFRERQDNGTTLRFSFDKKVPRRK